MKYEINLPNLHEIAKQQIKDDFMKSIIEDRMRTQKIIEDQGISVLAVLLAEVLSGILEEKDLHETFNRNRDCTNASKRVKVIL